MEKQFAVWHNGKFITLADAKVPVLSHALHYGSGAFEGIRTYETAYGPAVFRLNDHVERFFRSAAALNIEIPHTKPEIETAVKGVVSQNHFRECYIRPFVFHGEGQMALFPQDAKAHVAVAAWPWGAYLGGHGALSVTISPYVRFHPWSVPLGVKISGLYAVSVIATQDARARGFDECIMLDYEGFVGEGPGENIFLVKDGVLLTPNSRSVLKGITRDSVMQIARDMGVSVAEKKISLQELMSADEVFFTGTATEVAAIGSIDGEKIGTGSIGPITQKIRTTYLDSVHGKMSQYQKWVTLV